MNKKRERRLSVVLSFSMFQIQGDDSFLNGLVFQLPD